MSAPKSAAPVIDPGLCRCCGSMKRCRFLNVEYQHLGTKEVYSEMIMDCFGLLISYMDSKPSERLVCATCVQRLREAVAFRKQVLLCEEAFLQMKMLDTKAGSTVYLDQQHEPKVEVEVKVEVEDYELGPADDHDALAADHVESARDSAQSVRKDTMLAKNEDSNSNDDTPLHTLAKRKAESAALVSRLKPKPKPNSSPKISRGVRKVQEKKSGVLRIVPKPKIPMSRVQEMTRERDPTYMMEINILTIIEYSYACPFKCRHNNLLCYYCGEYFMDPELLRDHTEKKHNPKKFKISDKLMVKVDLTRIDCRLCTTKIDSLEAFKRHLTAVHKKKYYFEHKDSILPFKLTKELHCALCDVRFQYFHALNKHMNVHFSNYVCEMCGLGFVDRGRFLMHQQRHEVGDYPCGQCGKVFKAQYNRDLHIDRVHEKRARVYCPKCDMKLMTYQHKLKHLVEVHGDEPLSFTCDMCERVFANRRMLTVHRRKDHLKDFRYECKYCGQKFFTRFALTNHEPTHTGERNFHCKVCEKAYPRLKTLKDHMRIHTNDRRYRCQICGQAFIQNCSLKGHMKSQHSEYG